MSAVVKAVKSVGDAVGGVIEGVGKVVKKAGDVLKDAASWVNDNVIKPMLDDPITTIASIAAVATGNAWALPYINAASTAAKGGDLGDVALSFAASYAGTKAGDFVGRQVSQSLSTVVVDAAGNVSYVPTTTSNLASSTAAGATRGGVTATIQGGDIEQGLLTGAASGFAGGVGREAGNFVYEATDSKLAADIAAGATRGATFAGLTDRDIGTAAIMGGADLAFNNVINYGSEMLFGDRATQEDWEKNVTRFVGGSLKQAGMREIYEGIADSPAPRPRQYAQAPTNPMGEIQTTEQKTPESFELRRFINDAGEVIYITFRDGQPQQQIPQGYREDTPGGTPNTRQMIAATQIQQPLDLQQTQSNTGMGTTMPQVTAQAPSATQESTGTNLSVRVAKGGVITKKEKKPTTRKGLAAKKK
jgi:hypothetical protein